MVDANYVYEFRLSICHHFYEMETILSLQTGGSRACCGALELLVALEVNYELVKQNTGERALVA